MKVISTWRSWERRLNTLDYFTNPSVTGSLATILWLLALRKDPGDHAGAERLDVSFWKFLKIGVVAMRSAYKPFRWRLNQTRPLHRDARRIDAQET
jgi:hypothetical protein